MKMYEIENFFVHTNPWRRNGLGRFVPLYFFILIEIIINNKRIVSLYGSKLENFSYIGTSLKIATFFGVSHFPRSRMSGPWCALGGLRALLIPPGMSGGGQAAGVPAACLACQNPLAAGRLPRSRTRKLFAL